MKDENKQRLKRQLITGGIYIALAAAVVGVTTSSVVKLINGGAKLPEVPQTKYGESKLILPEIPEVNTVLPNSEVSGTQDGVNAEVSENADKPEPVTASPEKAAEDVESPEKPLLSPDDNIGYTGYIKPCDGYISREYSDDVLVYSPTMYDYRTHCGVDIAAEVGTQVKAIAGGVISDVSDDDLYGTTITVDSRDGLSIKYCNLSPELPDTSKVGNVVQTGSIIAGIGQTALCEASEAPHVHIEALRNGESFNPADLFEEANSAEAASAIAENIVD